MMLQICLIIFLITGSLAYIAKFIDLLLYFFDI